MPYPRFLLSATAIVAFSGLPLALADEDTPEAGGRPVWTVLDVTSVETEGGGEFEIQTDGSVYVYGEILDKDAYEVEVFTELKGITAFRIEVIPDERLPKNGPGWASHGNFVLSQLTAQAAARRAKKLWPVPLRNPTASYAQDVRPVIELVDGYTTTGWSIYAKMGQRHVAVVETEKDITHKTGSRIRFRMEFRYGGKHTLGRFRLSATTAERPVRAEGSPEEDAWHEVQAKINVAITDGVDFLLDHQELDGSWEYHQDKYRTGQTGLAVYTLLKSGVRRDHPSIKRAVEFLRSHSSRHTYSMACHIMALCIYNDQSDRSRIEAMVDELVSWSRGGYAYPDGSIDLSNTQYAALALWTAAKQGYKVPEKVWNRMADRTLKHQEEVRNPYGPAGFRYRQGGASCTGSMTAAGVGILAICEQHIVRNRGDINQGIERGVTWLAEHFDVRANPDPTKPPNNRWLLYYLYGLERVGGLTGVAKIGDHDWYREGARALVESQKGEGKWSTASGEAQPNTCFALLFLSRATGATTGTDVSRGTKSYGSDNPSAAVSMRASGDSPLSMWISSFGDFVHEGYAWPGQEGKGPRVEQVEYMMYGDLALDEPLVIARVNGDPKKPAVNNRFAARFTFKRPGTYWVYAAVMVRPPPDGVDATAEPEVLESEPFKVKIVAAPDQMLYRYAGDAGRNLLNKTRVLARASSELNDSHAAALAADNLQSRGWVGLDSDTRPSLTLDLERPVRATRLLLSHAVTGDKKRKGRIQKVEVEVNRKEKFIIEMSQDPQRKTEFVFPRPQKVRRLAFVVLEATPGTDGKSGVGFAEIELQKEK